MEPPAHLGPHTAEQTWITDGPNSGGIRGWLLWHGHLFAFENEGHTGTVQPGISVAAFLDRYGESHDRRLQQIVQDLRDR